MSVEPRCSRPRSATSSAAPSATSAFLLLPVVVLFVVLQVTASSDSSSGIKRVYANPPGKVVKDGTDYTATIDTSEGKIQVALDTDNSLKAANNFVFLAQHKFYDGLRFVRVAKDFVIQAGSPNNTTSGGPGYTNIQTPPTTIAGTPAYPLGTVAMAKTPKQAPGSFGSVLHRHRDRQPRFAAGLYDRRSRSPAGSTSRRRSACSTPRTATGRPPRR